ncbi:GAP family protein [Mycobacterium mantenii]|uniref:GAP family protein n=1 Tax=Mycobacterium mantenii TaxID=560555 RepID=A0A1A2T5W1_MYCNT|nr:GAP family protein [Mycobacterium mantenii]OBH41280.1 hypothetical protein A5688_17755 [Mycobacterium mantenii]OBH48780.1 hypothetical protein A5687_15320 [Mycobacterium mantenii]OBH68753.1 hypothetical protein A5683_06945 [Mycobacterium mantenii]OBH71785.1 hypothetical protein A5682_01120 [Mycobacterium mantenii]
MWLTVLILAGSVILEPVRLSLAVLLLGRRRPLLQLLVFLCGGLTIGSGVGLVVLFVLRSAPMVERVSVAQVQVAAGLAAVLVAATLATDSLRRKPVRRAGATTGFNGGGTVLLDRTPPHGLAKLAGRARVFLRGDSLRVAWVSGIGAALPSANYMAALAAILASHAGAVSQVQAVVAYNLVAFTVVEIPLVGYLLAPRRTRALMVALQTWLRSRTQRDIAALIAAGGVAMLALGLTGG